MNPPVLETIPGLDVSAGLYYAAGDEGAYRVLLRHFEDHYRHGLPDLEIALTKGDVAAARRSAHSVRGACATVGAVRIAAQAGALEKALVGGRSPESLSEDALALTAALAALLDELRPRLRIETSHDAGAPDPQFESLLDRLDSLLVNADFAATALWEEIAPKLRVTARADQHPVGAHLRAFDYDRALSELRRMRASAPKHGGNGALSSPRAPGEVSASPQGGPRDECRTKDEGVQ